jgi:hypothetical protein
MHLYSPGSPISDQSRFIWKMLTTILNDVLAVKRNVLTIDRSSVEQGDVSECAARLKSLTATRDRVLANNGSVSVLVTGYESDPRQLFEIEEVRRYLKRLDDHQPQWFHLCSRTDATLKLIFMCTSRVNAMPSIAPGATAHTFDREHLRSFLMRHYHAMRGLHDEFGVPQITSENISGLVISYFKTMTSSRDITLH